MILNQKLMYESKLFFSLLYFENVRVQYDLSNQLNSILGLTMSHHGIISHKQGYRKKKGILNAFKDHVIQVSICALMLIQIKLHFHSGN
jgi:hypothetical protein